MALELKICLLIVGPEAVIDNGSLPVQNDCMNLIEQSG